MSRILIVDDDPGICLLLKKFLSKKGFEAYDKKTGQEALEFLEKEKVDLILCDFKLPDEDGIELLKKFKKIQPEVIVIIITGYSHVKIAVKAIKLGAYDYVTKPLYPDEILNTIKNALSEKEQDNSEGKARKIKNYLSFNECELIHLHDQIKLVAPTELTVIITGETGTGKEYLANTIHQNSKRAKGNFIAVDCGALPRELAGSELFGHEKGAFTGAVNQKKGSFEIANGGTLFLDEIGNLTYEIQVMMLRVLQERKFRRIGGITDINTDVRIIAATNEDLKKAVEDGKFREDLYHRLNEFSFFIPPLRDRKKDIIRFASYFLKESNNELGKNVNAFTPEVETVLMQYPWHGNLRELRNAIKRTVLLAPGNEITIDCLPAEIAAEPAEEYTITIENSNHDFSDLKSASEQAERERIILALKQTNHNKSKTANLLNIDRKTLYNKIKSYNIRLEK